MSDISSGHVFFMCRFSILSKDASKSWKIGKTDFDVYREQLFDESRLNLHLYLFEKYTVPSIVYSAENASFQNYSILVYTSKQLPSFAKDRLYELQKKYGIIEVVELDFDQSLSAEFLSRLKREKARFRYLTVRIDDDDMVADDFVRSLEYFNKDEFIGFAVSFGYGFEARFNSGDGDFTIFNEHYYPKSSVGLSFVNFWDGEIGESVSRFRNVYGLGSHTKVDKKVPTVIISDKPMIFRTSHEAQDTEGRGFFKRNKGSVSVNRDAVKKAFKFI